MQSGPKRGGVLVPSLPQLWALYQYVKYVDSWRFLDAQLQKQVVGLHVLDVDSFRQHSQLLQLPVEYRIPAGIYGAIRAPTNCMTQFPAASRWRIHPTAIGLTPRSFLSKAAGKAPKIKFKTGGWVLSVITRSMKEVRASSGTEPPTSAETDHDL